MEIRADADQAFRAIIARIKARKFERAVNKANKALYQQAKTLRQERAKYAPLPAGEAMRKSAVLRGELSRICEAVRKIHLAENGLRESRETVKAAS